jgi:hypothetical protein
MVGSLRARNRDSYKTRRFVESHLSHWQGARALYREGDGVSLVRLDDVITTTKQGLSTVCYLLPTPGLRDRPARWNISLSWEASSFTPDSWSNGYVPMALRFDQPVIDATLEFVADLHAAEASADHSWRAWDFARKFARLSAHGSD